MFHEIIQFVIRHWLLCGGFIIVLALIIFEELREKGSSGGRLTPQLVTYMINREEAAVVDIRETAAFREGHIAGSINIPQANILNQLAKLKKYQDKTLIVVDALGQKAGQIAAQLRKQGFNKTAILQGGIQSWRQQNLLLIKGKGNKNGKS